MKFNIGDIVFITNPTKETRLILRNHYHFHYTFSSYPFKIILIDNNKIRIKIEANENLFIYSPFNIIVNENEIGFYGPWLEELGFSPDSTAYKELIK